MKQPSSQQFPYDISHCLVPEADWQCLGRKAQKDLEGGWWVLGWWCAVETRPYQIPVRGYADSGATFPLCKTMCCKATS